MNFEVVEGLGSRLEVNEKEVDRVGKPRPRGNEEKRRLEKGAV